MKRTRAELHVAFVDWVESAAGDRILEYEEIRGYHLEQAYQIRTRSAGCPTTTSRRSDVARRRYLGAAGRRALARGDLPAAETCSAGRPPRFPLGDPLAVELLVKAGEALSTSASSLRPMRSWVRRSIKRRLAATRNRRRSAPASSACVCTTRRRARIAEGTLLREVEAAVEAFEQANDHMGLIRASHLLLLMHWTAGQYECGGASGAQHDRACAGGGGSDARDPAPPGARDVLDLRPHPGGRGRRSLRAPARTGRRRPEGRRADPRIARAAGSDARRTSMRRDSSTVGAARRSRSSAGTCSPRSPRSTPARSNSSRRTRSPPSSELRRDFETLDAMGERNYIATTAAYLAFALLLAGQVRRGGHVRHVQRGDGGRRTT